MSRKINGCLWLGRLNAERYQTQGQLSQATTTTYDAIGNRQVVVQAQPSAVDSFVDNQIMNKRHRQADQNQVMGYRHIDWQGDQYETDHHSGRLLQVNRHATNTKLLTTQYDYTATGAVQRVISEAVSDHSTATSSASRSSSTLHWQYNAAQQPVAVYRIEDQQYILIARYAYNAQGLRVKKTVYPNVDIVTNAVTDGPVNQDHTHLHKASPQPETTYFLYDQGLLMAEANGQGELIRQYVSLNELPVSVSNTARLGRQTQVANYLGVWQHTHRDRHQATAAGDDRDTAPVHTAYYHLHQDLNLRPWLATDDQGQREDSDQLFNGILKMVWLIMWVIVKVHRRVFRNRQP